jgi:RNA polymerase sigma-70 factor (ECF subfamily)
LTQIYQTYKQPVFNLAYQMLRDEHRANDVLQTVMLKMMGSIKSLSDSKKLNGWMKRVAYNTVIDVIRANKKLQHVSDDSVFDYSASDSLAAIESDSWDLEEYLKILNERERLVVWLYAVEGYSHAEIGEKMKLSEQNSRVIFSRAMRSLKQFAQERELSSNRRYEI